MEVWILCHAATAQDTQAILPLQISKTATTEVDRRRMRLEVESNEIKLYKELTQDPPAAREAAVEFLRLSILQATEQREAEHPDVPRVSELPQLGARLTGELKSQDPLVLARYAQVLVHQGKLEDAAQLCAQGLKQFAQTGYPVGLKMNLLQAQSHAYYLVGIEREFIRAASSLSDIAADWFAYLTELPGGRRVAWQRWDEMARTLNLQSSQWTGARFKYNTHPQKDPWLWEMFNGRMDEKQAWDMRGNGFANSVSPERWKGFQEGLTDAAKHYREAYDLEPTFPEPAAQMIGIAMNGMDSDSPRDWFNKSIAGQCDFWPAYLYLMGSLRPRWGGAHEHLVAFGEQCVRTKRFDTEIPFAYIRAIMLVEDESNWDQVAALDPQFYHRAESTLKKLASDPIAAGVPGKLSRSQAKYLTYLAGIANAAKEFQQVVDCLEQVGELAEPDWLRETTLRPKYHLSRAYAYLEFRDRLAALSPITQPPRNDLQRSQKMLAGYEDLNKLSQEPRAAYYLQFWVETARSELDFKEGKWVDLKFDKDLTFWDRSLTAFHFEQENSVIGNNTDQAGKALSMYYKNDFPGPKEMVAEVELIRAVTPEFMFGICLGEVHHSMATPDGLLLWVSPQKPAAGHSLFTTVKFVPISLEKKPTKIHLKAWGPHRIELYVDDQLLGESFAEPTFRMSNNMVGLGTPEGHGRVFTGVVRYKNVRVRKLTQEDQ